MRERLLGSLLHAHLCGSLLWHPNLWTVCYGSLLISKLEQKYYDDNNSVFCLLLLTSSACHYDLLASGCNTFFCTLVSVGSFLYSETEFYHYFSLSLKKSQSNDKEKNIGNFMLNRTLNSNTRPNGNEFDSFEFHFK
ncbi:hypothetical protein T4A_7744 [Trichinella pseudospiralis]|uniref:Uncharacterized protein n=1 Tax=Trichinella pseudospiralis TaxID=6337 RepID=A0A0V1E1V8_TRIPS|nr:hypothetical protein T4A_7744 [Trichinella pseudospiralis]